MEKLYKKDIHVPGYYKGVVSHPEPDFLEGEVKWALGSTAINKANGCNGIPVKMKPHSHVWLFVTPWTTRFPRFLPGSSLQEPGIFQARILEWIAISFSRRYSQPRDWTRVSHIVGRSFTIGATRKVQWNSSRTIQNPKGWCHQGVTFNMSANREDPAVATGLEEVNPHPNSQER